MTDQPNTGARSGSRTTTTTTTPGSAGATPAAGSSMGTGRSSMGTGSGGSTTEKVKDVAGEASGQAKQVVEQAKEQTREVMYDARDSARDLLDRTQSELRDQAEVRTQHAAQGLRSWGEQLQALREGRPSEAGQVSGYLGQAQHRVNDLAQRLEQGGFQGVMNDAARFARRRPGTFLVACAAAGFMLARLARSQAGANGSGNGSSGRWNQSTMGYDTPYSGYDTAGMERPATTTYDDNGAAYIEGTTTSGRLGAR